MASRSVTSSRSNSIPDGWRLVRLEDVIAVNPRRPKMNIDLQDEVTFIPMAAVGENCSGILARDVRKYESVAKGYTYFQENDVLFAKITPCLQNGKHALATFLRMGFGFGTTEFHVLRAKDLIEPRHLFRVITQPVNIGKCTRSFTGTAGQQRVQPDTIKSLPILLPPLSEQQAIAEVLDSIDEAIEATEAVIAATEGLRDALLHRMLTRGVPGWHSEWREVRGIGVIPADWEVVRLGEVCTHVGSGVTPRGGKSAYVASGITFLRSQNVHFEGLSLGDVAYISQETDKSMRRSRVLTDDVLLNITGASIGRCTIVPRNLGPANVNQHVCIIRTTEAFNRYFVTKWLSTPRSQREIDDLQVGQSRQGLNYGQIRQIRIVQPPRFEQDRIAEMIESVDAAIERGQVEIEMLQSLKASAADALLTGRVRITK